MIKAVDIQAELSARPFVRDRREETEAAANAAFAELARFGNGAVFAGGFSGESPWERHRTGDELVHVLSGSTTLTILTEDGRESIELTAGMILVVPQGSWHRFHSPDGVTLLPDTAGRHWPLPASPGPADGGARAGFNVGHRRWIGQSRLACRDRGHRGRLTGRTYP